MLQGLGTTAQQAQLVLWHDHACNVGNLCVPKDVLFYVACVVHKDKCLKINAGCIVQMHGTVLGLTWSNAAEHKERKNTGAISDF